VSDVADLCANMAIINKGHVLLCGEPARLIEGIEGRIWARFVTKQDLPAFQKRHTVISTRLLTGRPLVHVYAERDPGDEFEPIHPTLEDVYFATIAGRHNALPGNC
jgi:ABC-type multidrug transport system ATPase subunit